jgi:truncated hemoglobin YjbI
VDIPYAALDKDPVGELHRIYETLDLGGWNTFEPRLKTYLGTVENYEKNKAKPLPEPIRLRLAERWGPWTSRWGYAL